MDAMSLTLKKPYAVSNNLSSHSPAESPKFPGIVSTVPLFASTKANLATSASSSTSTSVSPLPHTLAALTSHIDAPFLQPRRSITDCFGLEAVSHVAISYELSAIWSERKLSGYQACGDGLGLKLSFLNPKASAFFTAQNTKSYQVVLTYFLVQISYLKSDKTSLQVTFSSTCASSFSSILRNY